MKLVGQTTDGKTVTAGKDISILPVHLSAGFHPTQTVGSAGERISFHPISPLPGYRYEWTLTASKEMGTRTATQKQVLLVCNADSKNGLNFSNPQAMVTTDKPLWNGATEEMTVDWWMNPSATERSGAIGDTQPCFLLPHVLS